MISLRSRHGFVVLLFALGILGHPRSGVAQLDNPFGCSDSTVARFEFEAFRDVDGDGLPDQPLSPGEAVREGEVIFYRAAVQHSSFVLCGFESGDVCIDPPGSAPCPPDSPDVGGFGEPCCEAGLSTLLCSPVVCVPPGFSQFISAFVPYRVDPADLDNAGCEDPDAFYAVARYRNGFSLVDLFFSDPDFHVINMSIPRCDSFPVEDRSQP